jgi:4-hydroxy-tetrahydrodipicolinate reductase
MKKINITISGALGRMGKILIKRISKNKNLKLFSLTDLKSGKNINGIKTQKNNLEAFKKTDVIIDFSRPKASIEILNYAKKLKKKVVIVVFCCWHKPESPQDSHSDNCSNLLLTVCHDALLWVIHDIRTRLERCGGWLETPMA